MYSSGWLVSGTTAWPTDPRALTDSPDAAAASSVRSGEVEAPQLWAREELEVRLGGAEASSGRGEI